MKKSTKIMLVALLACFAASAAQARHGIFDKLSGTTVTLNGQPPREGSGTTAAVIRSLPRFTKIELRSAERLKVTRGDVVSVKISGDDNLLELIGTDVRGETLIIEPRSSYRTRKSIVVEVTMPKLGALTMAGSGDAVIEAIDPNSFKLDIDGSGNVVATGTVDALEVEINGSGNADLPGVSAKRVEAEVNGSGNISVGVVEALDAEINGSGDIVYQGEPKSLKTWVNGSGSIRKR